MLFSLNIKSTIDELLIHSRVGMSGAGGEASSYCTSRGISKVMKQASQVIVHNIGHIKIRNDATSPMLVAGLFGMVKEFPVRAVQYVFFNFPIARSYSLPNAPKPCGCESSPKFQSILPKEHLQRL